MNFIRRLLVLATIAFSIASTSAASATSLLFSYTPGNTGTFAFTFNIDQNPTVEVSNGYFSASITNATGDYLDRTSVNFFDLASGGIFDFFYGAQIFTGQLSEPTFLTGSFDSFYGNEPTLPGVVTISEVNGAVPEPTTWLLMIVGFGLTGSVLRRRPRVSYPRFRHTTAA